MEVTRLHLRCGNLDMYSNFIKSPSRASQETHDVSDATFERRSSSRFAIGTIGFDISLERDGSDEIGTNPFNCTS